MLLKRLMLTLSVLIIMTVNSHAQETVAIEESASEQENASLEETVEQQESDDASVESTTVVNNDPSVAKTLSGISIIGNEDAPKSLYIVPWRGSELELETDLNSSLLNEGFHSVDKDVFIRELEFYKSTTVK